jgi:GNAT superfamily N-acetyltransferase
VSISPSIRLSLPADRDAILAFIARQGFNPRDAVTWDGLNMLAMTAWDGDYLVGAIPLEPRELRISGDQTLRCVHETVVAVDESYRRAGLGSKMQVEIAQQRPADAQFITVFREDPASPAFRWYLKNGFYPAMHVESWFCHEPVVSDDTVRIWQVNDPSVRWDVFDIARPPGRIIRETQPWLKVHPYRRQYSFWIVSNERGSAALLGVGTMHSETIRADVLTFVASDESEMRSLLRAVVSAAAMKGWRPVRLPLAVGDPLVEIARSIGMKPGWAFDMLVKNFSPLDTTGWRYAGIDYA